MSQPHPAAALRKMLSVKPWINRTRQGLWDEAARLTIKNAEQVVDIQQHAKNIRYLHGRVNHFIEKLIAAELLLAKCGEQGGERCPSCEEFPNDVCLDDRCYGGWIVEVSE